MDQAPSRDELRQRFFTALLEATFPLKTGPDPEITQEVLIEATGLLKDHLEHELEEIRVEQAD